jgi:hypothetical protein
MNALPSNMTRMVVISHNHIVAAARPHAFASQRQFRNSDD